MLSFCNWLEYSLVMLLKALKNAVQPLKVDFWLLYVLSRVFVTFSNSKSNGFLEVAIPSVCQMM